MDDIESILLEYSKGPLKLDEVCRNLSNEQLDLSLEANTWTIRQIIHHIVDGDDIWKTCMEAAIGNPEGEFHLRWYWDVPQIEWSDFWKYSERSIELALALYQANRNRITELLSKSPEAWGNTIRLPGSEKIEDWRISVKEIVQMHNRHIQGHLEDINKILESKR